MLKKILSILFPLPSLLFAQQNLPLNREFNLNFEKYNSVIKEKHDSSGVDTSISYQNDNSFFKPYIISIAHQEKDKSKSLFYRKLKKESLFIVNDTADKFYLTIDPLFNFEYGKDLSDVSDEKLYKNTRGIILRGDIGKKISLESSFYENQATFVKYIDNFIDTFNIVPGQGRVKNFKNNGYDFAMSAGYVSYSLNKHFNFQAGHGKHFVGDGYRSLLLSDNSFDYSYLRVTSSFGKFQYTNLYCSFMNLNDGGVITPAYTERLFQKKAGNFQLLDWNINKRIQLGIFQGIIWKASDNVNKQKFNFYYFNPLLLVNLFNYSLHDNNNILLGALLKTKITNTVSFYAQLVVDDFAKDISKGTINNKQGYQIGLKTFDLFKIKNLHFQAEYNAVRPYTYSHAQAAQSYSHYNQPLAHPLGANFKEAIVIINYRLADFLTELKFNYALIGADSTGTNFGNNIFYSNNTAFYGINSTINEIRQGIKTTLSYNDFKVGYVVNPKTNLNIVLGILSRTQTYLSVKNNMNYFYIGIRTSLSNYYYDF